MTKQLHILLTLLLAMIFTSGGVHAAEETIDFTQQGFTASTAVTTVNGTDFTATFSKGANKSNAPKYYTSGGASVRMYIKNTLTISSSYTITKIEVTLISLIIITLVLIIINLERTLMLKQLMAQVHGKGQLRVLFLLIQALRVAMMQLSLLK